MLRIQQYSYEYCWPCVWFVLVLCECIVRVVYTIHQFKMCTMKISTNLKLVHKNHVTIWNFHPVFILFDAEIVHRKKA